MKVYIACASFEGIKEEIRGADVLVAYPYINACDKEMSIISTARNFILDSGVFTMINSGKRFDIKSYIDSYADFIREHNIRQYVEMDVDQIYGVSETRKMRDHLENRVGWQSIPVWHTIRGKESFLQDCKDYNYIALGYFLTEGLSNSLTIKYAKAFVDKAHELKCRIHGLGFTRTKILKDIPFDSVDSSSWVMAKRFGTMYKFDLAKGCITAIPKKEGVRLKERAHVELGRLGFCEWKKYQTWAMNNLNPIW